MKESYGEGIANRTGLGSYAGIRKGEGGTLIEVRTGEVLSREMNINGTPRPLNSAEGETKLCVKASGVEVPRGQRP